MSYRIDYYIKYDPEKDDEKSIFMKIIYATILKRIIHKKPTITHISGKSGEGKSLTVLYIMDILLKMQRISIKDYMDDINIYKQSEYPSKLRKLMESPILNKVNCMAVHEGREAMEANEWYSTFNRNVAHVNALSRAIKRLAIFIVSQDLKDITKNVRRTLDYQIKLYRPLRYGVEGNARLQWNVMYIDDRNPEDIRLRKRPLRGVLILPNGKYIIYKPSYISIPLIEKELKDLFEKRDKENKWSILKERLEEMDQDIKNKEKHKLQKIEDMVEFYAENEEARIRIAKTNKRNNYKVTSEFKRIHDLKPSEIREFEEKLKKKLEEKNEGIAKF